MADNYKDYALEAAYPPFLQTDGAQQLRALGDIRDDVVARVKHGIKARFPLKSPPDALLAIGDERGLPRGPVDTDATYADRLKGAWDTWAWAGTPTGVLNALWDAGYTNVVLITQTQTFTFDVNRELVTTQLATPRAFSPGALFWNAFLIWFPQPFITRWQIDGVPLTNSTEADYVRGLVNRWKPGHAMPVAYIATTNGHFYGEPGLEFGDAGLEYGGTNVRWAP